MKRLSAIGVICLSSFCSYAQTEYKSNGPNNLEKYCDDPSVCVYMAIPTIVTYPENGEGDKHWELHHFEIAANKKSGLFVVTGDMAIQGVDTAALLAFDILFYDIDDQLLYTHKVENYEFYNEANHAEPILVTGELNYKVAEDVEFVSFNIKDSKLIPYYEMKSDCYHACKAHQLNEAIDTFKKTK